MRLTRRNLWAIVSGLVLTAAVAVAGSSTIGVLDGAGASKTYAVTTEAGGNFISKHTIWDSVAGANGVSVSAANAMKVDGSAVTQPISGTVTVTATNLSANVAQINGVTPLMGNGVSGTGALRVTVASDSTGVMALAAGSAVIGHVICDSGCSGSGGTSQNDNSVYTDGTTAFNAIGGEYNTAIANLTSGRVGAVQLTIDRMMYANIGKINGIVPLMGNGVTGTGALRVSVASDSTGTSIVTQATGTNLHVVCDSGCGSASSSGYSNSATFTTGTTAYAIADAVGASGAAAAVSFTTMGPASTEVMVISAELEIDTTAPISGESSYTLYLYNVTPPSAINDSAAWTLPSGDRASFLGAVQMGTPAVPQPAATTLYVRQDNINTSIKLGATPTIFAYLVTNTAFTPTARVYKITLHTLAL